MSILHQQLISALREAGDEGLPESEIMALGGMWWRTRLKEIRRWKLAVIGEQDGRYYLVSEREVESDHGEAESGRAEIPMVALSSEPLVLFPSGSSHYREAA
jgi:hypothetical protein